MVALLCLGAACTGCIDCNRLMCAPVYCALPRRCLHGVHPALATLIKTAKLCLGAACTGCIGLIP